MTTGPEKTMLVERSASLSDAIGRFMMDLKQWIYDCIDRYDSLPPTDCHDQLTYTTGWEPYLLGTNDQRVFDFLASERDKTASHFVARDLWRHGYWRMQEAHHGTEHFELFLGFLLRVLPGDPETARQLVDAVEHIGNWSDEVPGWFDYSTGLFRSLYFGADSTRSDEHQLNMPDHLRCTKLLLLAHDATGEEKYLDLALRYGRLWAEPVCDTDESLPVGISTEGVVRDLSDASRNLYRSFAGMAGDLVSDLDRAENILASGGLQLFLELWTKSEDNVFLDAVKRLLDVLAPALNDADADPAMEAVRSYRRVTGGKDFDDLILKLALGCRPREVESIGVASPPRRKIRPAGIGKRADQPLWYEDGEPRCKSPVLLSLAAEISDDDALATHAVDMARTYFVLARDLFRDGHDHGCAADTVSAVARGHGRNNHAGMTTAVLSPAMRMAQISGGDI